MEKERKPFTDWDVEMSAPLIRSFEGLRLESYKCQAGVWTIGYGHTGGVKEGQKITIEEAESLLRRDLLTFRSQTGLWIKAPVSKGEFIALMSFVFNVGIENFSRSTMLKRLNAGDYSGAGAEFPRWVFAGGRKLLGLVGRREAERNNFDTF